MNDRAEVLLGAWLAELGFEGDPEMVETAARFTELMREFRVRPDPDLGTIAAGDRGAVVLRDVPFHSLCAHHLVPFFGTATVAYLPDGKLAGFGGIARVIEHFARRPQIQERMAGQIADLLFRTLAPRGLVVRLVARQLRMEIRGARATGSAEVITTRGDVDLLRTLV